MAVDGSEAVPSIPPGDLLNVFALVIYIPEPLGAFLDGLRRELVPRSNSRAHVSVLPPRPLADVDRWREACADAGQLAEAWTPFPVEISGTEVFPATDVIYLELGSGAGELRRMHTAMNRNRLAFREPFDYHPHITLAQDVDHSSVREMRTLAASRWRDFAGPRSFTAASANFVRNSIGNRWIDLAGFRLGSASPAADERR